MLSESSDKNYNCDYCGQNFDTDDVLQRHYMLHISDHYVEQDISKNPICNICEVNFTSKEDLQNHLLKSECKTIIINKDQAEVSPSTSDVMSSKEALSETSISDNVIYLTPENCNITNVYIISGNTYSTPNDISGNKNSSSLEDVDTNVQSDTEVTVFVIPPHENVISSSETNFTDVHKENSFSEKSSETKGDNEHSGSSEAICELVISDDDTFHNKGEEENILVNHKSIKNIGRYECLLCGKCYNHRLSLTCHQRNKHGRTKPYECLICAKTFALRKYLRKHILIHSEEKPYTCELCLKGFIRKDEYEIHMMIHRGETPPSTCKMCGKVCFSMSNLRNHILTHHKSPESYRHKCNSCNKKFSANYLLQRHIKTHLKHTSNKFICGICGIFFKSRKSLSDHELNIHAQAAV